MRTNAFNDPYLSPGDDISLVMAGRERVPDECHARIELDEENGKWYAEILENAEGEPVFYMENYDSRDLLRNELLAAGFSARDIQFL